MEENTYLEFKRQYTDNIKKEIVSFLNAGGGKIIIGIDDEGRVVGVENLDDCMLRIINSIRAISPDAMSFVAVQPVVKAGKTCIEVVIEVGTNRPYYLRKAGMTSRGVYMRIGPSCQPMSQESILKMIDDNGVGSFEENRSLEQKLTFNTLNKKMAKMNMPFDRDILLNMRILDDVDQYTNLGLLLSDQNPFTTKAVHIQSSTKTDLDSRREFTGSLLKQLDDASMYLSSYNKDHAYPTPALWEVLTNMFIHRDYTKHGSNYIYIYNDHMEFRSRGQLIDGISLETVRVGFSESRNRYLAEFFYHLQLTESYGTGIHKIIDGFDDDHEPLFVEVPGEFVVTLYNMHVSTNKKGKEEHENVDEKLLAYLKKHPFITRLKCEQLLDCGPTKSYRVLSHLVEKGKVKKIGNGRNTKYALTNER